MRLIKSESEISQMKFASDVSSLAHITAMRHSGKGATENQLQSIIEGFSDMRAHLVGLTHRLSVVAKTPLYFTPTNRTRTIVRMATLF